VDRRVTLHTHQTVLFGVVQPVPCATGDDQPVQLVRFHPNQLFNTFVPPLLEALPAQLHRPAGDPQEDDSLVLQQIHP
jgi:hypothetical protein